jgi:hypothetical protein
VLSESDCKHSSGESLTVDVYGTAAGWVDDERAAHRASMQAGNVERLSDLGL